MKNLFIYLLVFSVLLNSFSSMVSIAGYELNKTFISKVLCIKKDVPKSGCHGKCHLKKELQKQEGHQSKSGNPTKEKEGNWTFTFSSSNSFHSYPLIVSFTNIFYKDGMLNIPFVKSVFHPPAELVA
jgi:hypothetical protein